MTLPGTARQRSRTPIYISPRLRTLLILAGLALLAAIVWAVPSLVIILLGGLVLALLLSYPASLFMLVMPRSYAVALAFLVLVLVLILAFYVLGPLVLSQTAALIRALPNLVESLGSYVVSVLEALDSRSLLPGTPGEIVARLNADLQTSVGVVTRNLVSGTVGIVFGTFSFALTLFAVVFVAASLLRNERMIKAMYLRSAPARYRGDALVLWNDLAEALTRYVGGLFLVLVIQGGLSSIALLLIGVPYPLALGVWVAIAAVIPYLGAWIGAIPAVLVAISVSPTAALLTAGLFLVIQQLEGNFLTPRIQGQSIRLPAVLVFLGVFLGGALAGLFGVLFAVPLLAVLRVLVEFFLVRVRVRPANESAETLVSSASEP